MKKEELEKYLETYYEDCLLRKRLSDKTLRAYEIDLKQYIDFIDASTEVTKTIKDYIHFLYKKRNLIYFIVPAILIIILLFSNTVSIILVSTIFFINPMQISSNNICIIFLSLLSRIVFLALAYLFRYYDNKYRLNKNRLLVGNYWWSFCLFILSFLGVYTLLFEMIFYHIVNSTNMYKLLFQLIVMCCSFLYFILIFKKNIKTISF